MNTRIGLDVSDLCTNLADGTTRYTKALALWLPELAADEEWHFFAPCEGSSSPLAPPARSATSELSPFGTGSPRRSRQAGLGELARKFQWHSSPWPKYWTQARLPWDLYRYPLDVLFMPIQQIPIVRPKKMKTVAVMHDLAFHEFGEQYTYKNWALLHFFSAQVAREADALICVSQATANDVAKYYGRTENVFVVHHGVDHEHFKPSGHLPAGSRQADLGERLRQPYLLYVGQIQPRKNLVRLVEAFEILAARDKDLQLVIAGSHGWLQQPIFDRIQKSTVRERILLPGRVSDEDLPQLYSQAEVFVMPSLYEGFGMPILEAMASGSPVVTSDVSSMPEVSRLRRGYGGQAGFAAVLIDPYSVDSIVEGIQKARSERVQLIQRGLERAKEFTWEKTARATLSVLRGLQ